jgi:peptidoglycan/LPS O-acetylase OafA/YrhL
MNDARGRNVNLDFIRGIAALLVVMTHARYFQFNGFTKSSNLINETFYFLGTLGGDSVIVFFVLSGYFVGGSVINNIQSGRWSWTDYCINRLVRLWIVLIPALLLTLFWNGIALNVICHDIYTHRYLSTAYSFGLNAFLGNLFFLQITFCDPYGTNGSLWSLANEFWYYLIFPFLCLTIFGNKSLKIRFIYMCVVLFAFFIFKLGFIYFVIWLMGVFIHILMKSNKLLRLTGNHLFFYFSLTCFLAILLIGHLDLLKGVIADLLYPDYNFQHVLVALTFAGTMPFLLTHSLNWTWFEKTAHWLSEISYTLYANHFPMLAFLFFTLKIPRSFEPSLKNYLIYLVWLTLILIYAYGIWHLFERRTPEVRESTKEFISKLRLKFKMP